MSSIEIIPSETRSRGLGLMAAAAVVYLGLRFAGFHRLFAEDEEGIGALLENYRHALQRRIRPCHLRHLADLDNPFEGTWNADARSFRDLATKYH